MLQILVLLFYLEMVSLGWAFLIAASLTLMTSANIRFDFGKTLFYRCEHIVTLHSSNVSPVNHNCSEPEFQVFMNPVLSREVFMVGHSERYWWWVRVRGIYGGSQWEVFMVGHSERYWWWVRVKGIDGGSQWEVLKVGHSERYWWWVNVL